MDLAGVEPDATPKLPALAPAVDGPYVLQNDGTCAHSKDRSSTTKCGTDTRPWQIEDHLEGCKRVMRREAYHPPRGTGKVCGMLVLALACLFTMYTLPVLAQVQYDGVANYALRRVNPSYTGNLVQVRR